MLFQVFGPYRLSRSDNRLIQKDQSELLRSVEAEAEGLSNSLGVYIFGLQASGSPRVKPWYVGMTVNSFAKEAFGVFQLNHYNSIQMNYDSATPRIFFVPLMTPTGRFSSNTGGKTIEFLEDYFRHMAFRVNPELLNQKGLANLRNVHVPGILNVTGGHPGNAAIELRDCLQLEE